MTEIHDHKLFKHRKKNLAKPANPSESEGHPLEFDAPEANIQGKCEGAHIRSVPHALYLRYT